MKNLLTKTGLAVGLVAILLSLFAGVGAATPTGDKVTNCHATSRGTNSYTNRTVKGNGCEHPKPTTRPKHPKRPKPTTPPTTEAPPTTAPEDVKVTAVVAEVSVEDECSGRGILTIPDTEGIIFDLDNVPSEPGEYEVTSGDVVKATAREGFVLTNPDFEYVVEVTVNEDCVTTTVAETTTTEKPEVSSTSVVKPQAAAEELAFTGSSSIVGTLLGAALLLMGAAVLFFGRRKTTD